MRKNTGKPSAVICGQFHPREVFVPSCEWMQKKQISSLPSLQNCFIWNHNQKALPTKLIKIIWHTPQNLTSVLVLYHAAGRAVPDTNY
jgi:hypothetical protein